MESLATTGEMDITSEVAALYVYSGRLNAYSSAIGMTLVLYDFLLTISDEVSLIPSCLLAVSVLKIYLFFGRWALFGQDP